MSPLKQVALDTSILVGLIDSRDIWHPAALALRDALKDAQAQLVHFDCVISEAIQGIIGLVRDSIGALNFNDALIALGCRELGIECIATFDSDFDSIAWLKKLSSSNDIT